MFAAKLSLYRPCPLILDIGCGSGNITQEASESVNCNSVVGLDLNSRMIEYARDAHNNNGKIRFECADIGAEWSKLKSIIQVEENSVDAIISVHVLHWVQNQAQAVRNICTMLKPGKIHKPNHHLQTI